MAREKWTQITRSGMLALVVVAIAAILAPTDLVGSRGKLLQGLVGASCYKVGVMWYPDPGIYAQGILSPADGTVVAPDAELTFTAGYAMDMDRRVDQCGDEDYASDGITYTWSGDGIFSGGTAGSDASWQAPSMAGNYTVTLTVNDTPAGIGMEDGGSRDDEPPLTFSVTVTVDPNFTGVRWEKDTPIDGSIIQPVDEDTPLPGEHLQCSAYATDTDLRIDSSTGMSMGMPVSDTCTYKWSASGGTFLNGVDNQADVTWVAPEILGVYTITCTIDDQNDANKPSGEQGSRNDPALNAESNPLQCKRQVEVWSVLSPTRPAPDGVSDRVVFGEVGGARYLSNLVEGGFTRYPLTASIAVTWQVHLNDGSQATIVKPDGSPATTPLKDAYVKYNQLPNGNAGFGPKKVIATRNNRTIEREIRVFYHPDEKPINSVAVHPPISGMPNAYNKDVPNWFYYMTKISEVSAGQTFLYDNDLNNAGAQYGGQTRWVDTDAQHPLWPNLKGWICFLADPAYTVIPVQITGWDRPVQIDAVAWMCRHEKFHRLGHLQPDWGQNNRIPEQDKDPDGFQIPPGGVGDFLKDSLEPQKMVPEQPGKHPAGVLSADTYRTFADHWNYGVAYSDSEEFTLHHQDQWVKGSADAVDWSVYSSNWYKGL